MKVGLIVGFQPAASFQIDLKYDKSGGATRWAALFVVVLLWKVLSNFPLLVLKWKRCLNHLNSVFFISISITQTQNALAWIWVMRCKMRISLPPPPTPRSELATLVVNKWMWQKFVWSLISLVSLPRWTDHWDWNQWNVSLSRATTSSFHFLNGSIEMFRMSTGNWCGGFSDKTDKISIFANVYINLLPVCLNICQCQLETSEVQSTHTQR